MVVPTVSNAKNRMRRAINAIVDPWPRDEARVWAHFGNVCAYCGAELDRKAREGHLDHAVPSGGNQIGNLVLACATCNGDEKLAEDWAAFTTRKVADPDVRAARLQRIEEWRRMHPPINWTASREVEALVAELHTLVDEFGDKCGRLRTLVNEERKAAVRMAGR